jgi:hypothetical protein
MTPMRLCSAAGDHSWMSRPWIVMRPLVGS